MGLGQADCRERPQRHRQKRGHRRDGQRIAHRGLPLWIVEEVVVVLQAVSVRVQTQHFGREGEEILGVERQRDHHDDWRDQKEEDQPADDPERIVPDALGRCGIGRKSLAHVLSSSDQPLSRCEPSQKGLLPEWPQRHRTYFSVEAPSPLKSASRATLRTA